MIDAHPTPPHRRSQGQQPAHASVRTAGQQLHPPNPTRRRRAKAGPGRGRQQREEEGPGAVSACGRSDPSTRCPAATRLLLVFRSNAAVDRQRKCEKERGARATPRITARSSQHRFTTISVAFLVHVIPFQPNAFNTVLPNGQVNNVTHHSLSSPATAIQPRPRLAS
jgi:hypothetical protein